LRHSTGKGSPFCFTYFLGRVLLFCPGLAWTTIFLLLPPTVDGIRAVPHHVRLLC
jgi:hypothetical protein